MNMFFRITLDYDALANEIVAKIPEKHFVSDTDTFLDPAFAGGQLLKAVAKRLHKYEHSVENIRSRLFGYEDSIAYLNHPMNYSTAVIANLSVVNYSEFLEENMNKKFDVIVGNPPYQNNHIKDGESKRKVGNKLWYQFMFKADSLIKENGVVAMITPTQWMSGGVQMRKGNLGILKNIFSKKQLIVAKVANITEQYFKGIGINIGYTIYKNCNIYSKTKIILKDSEIEIDLNDIEILTPEPTSESISIVSKVMLSNHEKFISYYFNSHSKPGIFNETLTPTDKNIYPHWIMGSDITKNLVVMYFPEKRNLKVEYKKVIFPMSTRYWQPYLADSTINVATLGQALKVPEDTTQEGFKSVFYSKLFTYLCFNLQIAQNGFMKTVLVKALPKLNMNKIWTDEELYAHFGLTQEEINYIEANVK